MAQEQKGVQESAQQHILNFLSTPREVEFKPESSQQHFFFSVPVRRAVPREGQRNVVAEQAEISKEILDASPETKCTVIVQGEFAKGKVRATFAQVLGRGRMKQLEEQGRLNLHVVGGRVRQIWAQDLGQASGTESNPEFLMGEDTSRNFEPSEFPVPVTKIPISFQGGDLTSTTVNGKKLMVAGPQVIARTKEYYKKEFDYDISVSEIRKILKHAFDADDVVFLRNPVNEKDPELAIHIDLTVFFPKDGVAVMLDPESISAKNKDLYELKKSLEQYRTALKLAGFKVIEIPTSDKHASETQAYTNSVTVTKPDGGLTIIMPGFGDPVLESKIKGRLEAEGMEVRFVRNKTYDIGGNTNCLTGRLAKAGGMEQQGKPKSAFYRRAA